MSDEKQSVRGGFTSVQVYTMAVICLLIGVTVGYLVRGSSTSQTSATAQPQMGASSQAGAIPAGATPDQMTPDQMKRMADKQVAPLLDELKQNPNDTDTMIKVGGYYYAARQFADAAAYYEKAAAIKPTADVLTKLSNAQFYTGAGDKAIETLNQALKLDPKFANALYDLGMLKWQVQGDTKGAVASWEQLLKVTKPDNPIHATVEKMIAKVKEHEKMSAGKKTDKPAM